ncbi:SusC/RagA family TonB-linked outer membrane protein [Adhaeribacter pallidiroseus]|uniref:TonB-dependent receptor SusC n=1 Tax=Adhaeribacter pallidiroseus TaxID=2072847 RepID=A0A369QFM8_9BACT|nr:TonB-dependent receptor [Adhaeribacter pallidiroseus]RDC61699.1 TonB-dependent receptor SusC [Adhaeribacter pallidiroseus]
MKKLLQRSSPLLILLALFQTNVWAHGSNISFSLLYNTENGAKQTMQDTPITGKVTSPTGEILPGVTILLKGTNVGTTTANDGSFRLQVPDNKGILIFSFIGYQPLEVPLDGKTAYQVRLSEDAKTLNEVVVVGYGTQKRENVIGSISQVNADKLNNRQTTQLSNALTGQLPGVTVIQRSGQPGVNSSQVNIRGVGSFGAGTEPLIIVDGIQAGSFNEIDPNDIETISVLKDASSAAIYGARAANGVILITTKTGKSEKTRVTYNGYVGFQKATAYPDLVNSWEYAQLFNEATGTTAYSEADIQKFRDGSDPDNFPNTDFIGQVFSKNGTQTGHNLTISGGSNKNQYNLSLGYLFQDGLVVKNNYSRYNVRLNLTNQINNKLSVTTRLAAINSYATEPGSPATLDASGVLGIISSAVRYPAIYAGKLSTGYYGLGVVQKGTPISFLDSESFTKTKNQNLTANLRLDYQVIPDLKLSVIGGYNQTTGQFKQLFASQILNPTLTLGPNQLVQGNKENDYKTLQGLADYNKQINQHNIGLLLGYSFESNTTDTLSLSRDKLPGNDLTQIDVGAPDNQKNSGTGSEWAIQSIFGRLRYSFANKYLLEGTLRRDGSSRFPTSRRYALFPSVAVGYRLIEENFIKDKISWLTDLKIKGSYGILGNQNIANYPYQRTLNPGVIYSFGGNVASGVALTQLTDPNLHWESTRTADVGVDFSLFRGKLSGSANYFDRYTYDILYKPDASVSGVLGFGLSQQNTGKVKNQGWEFTLDHRNRINSFEYSVQGNVTIINNQVFDLGVGNIQQPNGLVGNGSNLFIGQPMNVYYGYVADGIFVNETDVTGWADMKAINPAAKPGDIRYKDISGPNGQPDGKVDATYDRVILGSRIPKYNFGLNLGSKYKGFDVNILLQGVAKVKGMLNAYAGYAFNNFGTVQRWQMDERWTAANPRADAGYPRLELISNSGTPNTLTSSFWVLDASYVRVKNVQLGYSLPNALISKAGIAGIRFYLSGENFYTWKKYRKGWDPEINSSGGFYPILGTYTFGINATF